MPPPFPFLSAAALRGCSGSSRLLAEEGAVLLAPPAGIIVPAVPLLEAAGPAASFAFADPGAWDLSQVTCGSGGPLRPSSARSAAIFVSMRAPILFTKRSASRPEFNAGGPGGSPSATPPATRTVPSESEEENSGATLLRFVTRVLLLRSSRFPGAPREGGSGADVAGWDPRPPPQPALVGRTGERPPTFLWQPPAAPRGCGLCR